MHITSTTTRHQRNRVTHYSQTSDSYRYFNLLTSDILFEQVESLLPAHRERRYPPTETLSLFLAQAMSSDRSCQNIVNQTAVDRIAGGLSQVSTCTGGYCRARKRLPKQMVTRLTQQLGKNKLNKLGQSRFYLGGRSKGNKMHSDPNFREFFALV